MTTSSPILLRPAPSAVAKESRSDLWWAAVIWASMGVGAMACGLLAGWAAHSAVGSRPHVLGAVSSGLLLGGALGGCLAVWQWTSRTRGQQSVWAFWGAVCPQRSLWHVLWEVPVAVVLQGLALAAVTSLLPGYPKGEALLRAHQDVSLPAPLVLVLGICIVLVLPALEEIVFRRLLFSSLHNRTSLGAALMCSSGVFGLAHLAPLLLVPLTVSGLCFGAAVLWHRSLWASWTLHCANNAVIFAAVLVLLS